MCNKPIFHAIVALSLLCGVVLGAEPEGLTADVPHGHTVRLELRKGQTLSHFYGAVRMAFPTAESLEPKARPASPKPYVHKRLPLQTHRVISNGEDKQHIVLGSDVQVTTSYWMKFFKAEKRTVDGAEKDLPDRWGSCVGMPDADWILDAQKFVVVGDVRVKGFKMQVRLADYQPRRDATGTPSPVSEVVHVTTQNVDPDQPGELRFLLATGNARVFVLSKKQGRFVLADMKLEGSPLVHMDGWEEKPQERKPNEAR